MFGKRWQVTYRHFLLAVSLNLHKSTYSISESICVYIFIWCKHFIYIYSYYFLYIIRILYWMPWFRVYYMLLATYHLCNDLNADEASRRRSSYELGTCVSSFFGLQSLEQEAFFQSKQGTPQEIQHIYLNICVISSTIWGDCTGAFVLWKKVVVLPMRLQKISSFTLTFRDAEVVSAGIWLAIMGGYKNLHAIKKRMYFLWGCTVDWKFVDGEYTWYWYYIYILFFSYDFVSFKTGLLWCICSA